jgi:hypothetical protein
MDGIYIDGQRPKSKKAVKEALAATPERVAIEPTAGLYPDPRHPALDITAGRSVHFVGPDPHRDRRFYGTIVRTRDGFKVT